MIKITKSKEKIQQATYRFFTDKSSLISLRKFLYENNLCLTDVINYIIYLFTINDSRLEPLVKHIKDLKAKQLLKGGDAVEIHGDSLYKLIELKKKENIGE